MTQETRIQNEIDEKYLTFCLGEEEYGVPVKQVTGIVKIDDLIAVPHSADYFIGLLDVRGRVMPVVDLKIKLDLPVTQTNHGGERAIIIEFGIHRIALQVDAVHSVNKFPLESIDAGPPSIKDSSGHYVTGVGKLEDNFVVLINLENLFEDEELKNLFKASH